MVRGVLRTVIHVAACAFMLVVSLPVAVYFWGIGLAGTMPTKPQLASSEQQLIAWQAVERSESIVVDRLTPFSPWLAVGCVVIRSSDSCKKQYPGYLAASFVAGRHLLTGKPLRSTSRHIVTASVAVWLTRHWSAAEIASRAYELEEAAARQRANH